MTDVFEDVDISKIDRINLQRQQPGQRGPGTLAHAGLPPYTDVDELIGLCEETGPGRYKAIALDSRGKALGPAWSWEVAAPPETPAVDKVARRPEVTTEDDFRELRHKHLEEIDALRAHHRETIEALRKDFEDRAEKKIEEEVTAVMRRADSTVEMEKMHAQRLIQSADQRATDAERKADNIEDAARQEIARLNMRIERLQNDLESKVNAILTANQRVADAEQKMTEMRARHAEETAALQADARVQMRTHEAELREIRNGSPEVNAAIARASSEWEIERARLLMQADLDERAREHGLGAYLSKLIQSEDVQSVIFPILNELIENAFAKKEQGGPIIDATTSTAQSA